MVILLLKTPFYNVTQEGLKGNVIHHRKKYRMQIYIRIKA